MKKSLYPIIVLTALSLSCLISCGTSKGMEGPELGDRALYDKAQEYIKDEDFKAAVMVLNTIENNFPNSIYYKQARLLKADALFAEGLRSSFIEAEAEYKAYITLYPTSDDLDYVQKQIALCRWNRHKSIKVDPSEVIRGIEEFNIFFKKYPSSKYVADVKAALNDANNHMAEHEEYVGDYYMKVNKFHAAEKRYAPALEYCRGQEKKYQLYLKLFTSLEMQDKIEESQALYDKLLKEKTDTGTDSPVISEIQRRLENLRKKVAGQPKPPANVKTDLPEKKTDISE